MESEKLNDSAANTMLKFLEEPEDDIIAFLITNNRYHVINTLLSRCQILSIKENCFNLNYDDNFIELLNSIVYPNSFYINYKEYSSNIFIDKETTKRLFIKVENIILGYLESKYINIKYDDTIVNLLSKKDDSKLLMIISIIEDELPKLEYNVNFKLWLDSLFSRFIGG